MTPHPEEIRACRSLIAALVLQTARNIMHRQDMIARVDYRQSVEWLRSDDGSFDAACIIAGVNPAKTRAMLLRVVAMRENKRLPMRVRMAQVTEDQMRAWAEMAPAVKRRCRRTSRTPVGAA